jgi:hypothetical protein
LDASGDLRAARRSSVTGKLAINASWFSPGEIDGKFGENATKALRAYAEAQQLPSYDAPTEDAWKALRTDDRPVVAGPFLPKLPSKMEDMKDISIARRAGRKIPHERGALRFHPRVPQRRRREQCSQVRRVPLKAS